MGVMTRLRRQAPIDTTDLLTKAIKVAQTPATLNELRPEERRRVDEVAKALRNGSTWSKPGASSGTLAQAMRAKPVAANIVAARAAEALSPMANNVTPIEIETALRQQGIDWVAPFAPGTPLTPFYGYNRRPRERDYPVGRNISTETRPGRIPFNTLRHLVESYDVAQICYRHAIQDLRSMRIRFEVMEGYEENAVKEIAAAKAFMRRPDKKLDPETGKILPGTGNTLRNWLCKHATDVWRFDCGSIYRQRDRAGRLISLPIPDGTLFAPMLDYFGDNPSGEAPAFQQYIQGIPWDWIRWSDLIYEPMWPHTEDPYGIAPIETILVNANTDLRLQTYFLQFFTTGQVPEAFAIAPEDQSDPDALADWQEEYNDWTYGDQSERWGLRWLPNGTELEFYKPQQFDPDVAEYVMRRTVAAFMMVPHDLGFTSDVNRSCYSEDTEVLTENGWKRHDEVGSTERIATFNPETKTLEYEVPTALHVYPYEGEMVHFQSNQVDVLVTPDHDMWVGSRSNGLPRGASGAIIPPWQKVHAEDLESRGDFWFADHATWDQGEEVDSFILPGCGGNGVGKYSGSYADRQIGMDLWLEFLGYIASEGCIFGDSGDGRYKISLSQNVRANPDKTRVIDTCIAQLPFAFASYDDKGQTRRWQVSDKALWTWLRANLGRYSGDKGLPDFVRSLGKRQLSILFDALMLGDGTVDQRANRTATTYYSKSWQLASDVQELAIKLGRRANIGQGAGVWRVLMSDPTQRGYQLRWGKNVTREHYEGTVWCFSVPPNSLFFTRRNGKVGIHGNTADTQMDTQFRINSLPHVAYYEDILDSILQEDLDLPVQMRFDTGREKEDRLMEAQAHEIYVSIGAESPDEVRDKVLGYAINPEEKVPRFFDSQRLGVIPLSYLLGVAGDVDPLTGAPRPGTVVQRDLVLPGTPGVDPLAEPGGTAYSDAKAHDAAQGKRVGGAAPKGPALPAPQPLPQSALPPASKPAGTNGPKPRPSAGVVGARPNQQTAARRTLKEADLQKWRIQSKRRIAKGKAPRPFLDSDIPTGAYKAVWEVLEGAGTREEVDAAFAKAYMTESEARAFGRDAERESRPFAGLALRAADTGRVLMVQRSRNEKDVAGGYFEFPGGHVDEGETCRAGALREWQEETGCKMPSSATPVSEWDSTNGVYRGYVYEIPTEDDVDLWDRTEIDDPDNPDQDYFEAILWHDPAHLSNNPSMRPELAADSQIVQSAVCKSKDPDPPVTAGIALVAQESKTVLMVRRGNKDDDEDGGGSSWEFPAGHLDGDEDPLDAATREWQEETGATLPKDAEQVGTWTSEDGKFQGFVYRTKSEGGIDLGQPDGHEIAAIAWWKIDDLEEDEIRDKVKDNLDRSEAILERAEKSPKAGKPKPPRPGPGGHREEPLVQYHAPQVQQALSQQVNPQAVASGFAQLSVAPTTSVGGLTGAGGMAVGAAVGTAASATGVAAMIAGFVATLHIAITSLEVAILAMWADAWLAGAKDGLGSLDAVGVWVPSEDSLDQAVHAVDWDKWKPGQAPRPEDVPGFADVSQELGRLITGISETTRQEIATLIEQFVAGRVAPVPWTPADVGELAAQLEALLGDPQRAMTIARTEVNRSMSDAAADLFRRSGIAMFDLIPHPTACVICKGLAAENPHPMSDTEAIPPIHPQCRCSIAPARSSQ